MRSLVRFLVMVLLLGVLAACSTTDEVILESEAEDVAVQEETAVVAAAVVPAHNSYEPDIALLSTTGRPQFVSAYANW